MGLVLWASIVGASFVWWQLSGLKIKVRKTSVCYELGSGLDSVIPSS